MLEALSCLRQTWPPPRPSSPTSSPRPRPSLPAVTSGGSTHDASWDAKKPDVPARRQGAQPAGRARAPHRPGRGPARAPTGSGSTRGTPAAKYSDGDPEYEQLLHVDYGNHTLVVPRTDVGYQHLELFVYLSDVTPETAATRMVSRRLTGDIPVERTYLGLDEYSDALRIRGARLRPGRVGAGLPARRVPPGDDDEGRAGRPASSSTWPTSRLTPIGWAPHLALAAEEPAWHRFVPTATVRQLTVLGFPEPGHPYWNEETLAGVAARYPRLDMTPWRQARSHRHRLRRQNAS